MANMAPRTMSLVGRVASDRGPFRLWPLADPAMTRMGGRRT